MKEVARLILVAIIAYFVIRLSMTGWRFWSKSPGDYLPANRELAETVKAHVYRLSHDIGDRSVFNYDKLEEAAEYISKELSSYGYDIEFQKYRAEGKVCRNIIAAKKGSARPDEIIVVGAHYDTCFNPGADDNASAVAGLLELARSFSGKQTNRTMRFIAFVNEEPPFFKSEKMGSRVYARAARKAKEDIRAAIILESIGYYSNRPNSQKYPPLFGLFYPNKGNFIAVVSNFRSFSIMKRVVKSFKAASSFPIESIAAFDFIPGVDFSDNYSFWKEGYPALMITDTAFYRNPNYHTNNDTYETLDYLAIAEVVRGLEKALDELSR